MLKIILRLFIVCIFIFLSREKSIAQITINGPRPQNLLNSNSGLSIGLTYGYFLWNDKDQKVLPGYSESQSVFKSVEELRRYNINVSMTFSLSLQKTINEIFALKSYVSYGKLYSDVGLRSDIDGKDKSQVMQLALYSSLTFNPNAQRFKIQWLVGPEFFYAKKDVLIADYMENSESTPQPYHFKENIVSAAVVTGLGISGDFAKNFTVFADMLAGIALPGNGLKMTNYAGFKYNF